MKNSLRGVLFAFSGLALATPAQAITFASGKGADSATCGAIASPCRTLKQAVVNAPAGGYVVLQGPADFGPATIEKALTVTGENGATIRADATVINGTGVIFVNAGANDVVRLRGLWIKDASNGAFGIMLYRGKRLEVDDCHIDQSNGGLWAHPWTPASQLVVTNTVIDAVGGAVSSPRVKLTSFYDAVNIRGTTVGITNGCCADSETLILVNSSISGASQGLKSYYAYSELVVRNTSISGGGTGVDLGGAALFLSRSTITGNTAAMSYTSGDGAILTFGDNLIRGNGDDTLTRVLPTNFQ